MLFGVHISKIAWIATKNPRSGTLRSGELEGWHVRLCPIHQIEQLVQVLGHSHQYASWCCPARGICATLFLRMAIFS